MSHCLELALYLGLKRTGCHPIHQFYMPGPWKPSAGCAKKGAAISLATFAECWRVPTVITIVNGISKAQENGGK